MLGFINMDTSLILKALQAIGEIRLVTSLTTSEWIAMVTGKSKHSLDTLEISIFGEFALSNDVGDLLSRAGLFLQAPAFNSNIPYHNPQMISFGDISDKDSECESTESHKCSGQIESKSTRPSAAALLNVLDHLQQHEYLHPVGPQSALTVELLHHQKEGIDFMTRREMGESTSSLSFWDMEANLNGRLYRHAITGLKTRDPLPGPFGGILADEMGLGKTLTTLATIISTLEHAEATLTTSSSNACSVAPKQRSKATLIVIPSEALMDQWIEEISK
ncbi:Helicase C-terminal [Penicillium sp. IBT 35674x]|nr:Helicase C-terminal [Penicillium sp. IBT 35674x]